MLPAINGTKSILEAALKEPRIKRIVLTSSFAAVVDRGRGPWPGHTYTAADWNPITYSEGVVGDPIAGYRAGRKFAERAAWDASVATGCRHTERYVRTGLERGTALIRARSESGAGSQAFGVAQFLARQHAQCPGPCGLDILGSHIISVAVSVGVPEQYAARAVANGLGRAA